MTKRARNHASDVRGLGRLAVEATLGVTGVVEAMHHSITRVPFPIGKRPVFLVLHLHRLSCRRCGKLRQDCREVAPARKSYSFALATLVLDLCKEMSLSAVAKHLQLDWHLCKDILKSDLGRRRERIRLRRVRRSAPTASFGSVAS